MSIEIPSLKTIARGVVLKNLEDDATAYYQGRTICVCTSNTFSRPSILTRAYQYITGNQIDSLADRLVLSTSPYVLFDEKQTSPRLLAAIEKAAPEFYNDSTWKRLFESKYKAELSPTHSSYRAAFIIHYLLDAINAAKMDPSRVAQKDLAFFTENISLIDGIEVRKRYPLIGNTILMSILNFAPKINAFIYNCASADVSEGALQKVIRSNPRIEHISLGAGECIEEKNLNFVYHNCRHLKSLHIPLISSNITDLETLEKIARSNTGLEVLELGKSNAINNQTLARLLDSLPNLKTLEIHSPETLDGEFLDLCFSNRSLDTLILDNCYNIDKNISSAPVTGSLKTLTLKSCGVSKEAEDLIASKFSTETSIHIS